MPPNSSCFSRLFALDTLRFGTGFVSFPFFWKQTRSRAVGRRMVTNGDNVVCCFNFEMRKVCNGVVRWNQGEKNTGHKGREDKRLKNCICCLWLG